MAGNIPEFNAPIEGLRPSESGIQAAVQAGRRIGVFYHQAGEALGSGTAEVGNAVQDEQFRQELSHGLAAQSQLWSTLTDSWNQTAKGADPNDASVAAKWRDSVLEPALTQWTDAFTTTKGRVYAEEQAARMRQHFFESTAADQSTLAGIASLTNLQTMGHQYGQTAFNDPSSLDTILGAFDTGYRASVNAHTGLTADMAARVTGEPLLTMKSDIVKQAIDGLLESGPNGIAEARRLLTSGKYAQYISDPSQFLDRATAIETRNAAMERQQTAEQERQMRIEGATAETAIFNDISNTIRGGGEPTAAQVKATYEWAAKYGGLLPGENSSLQSLLDRGMTDANSLRYQTSNPQVAESFYNRALLPATDPKALTQVEVDRAFTVDHTLSSQDHERLTQQITNRGKQDTPEARAYNIALKQLDQDLATKMRPYLTDAPAMNADGTPNILGTGGHDPNGSAAWGEARRVAHEIFDAWVKSGQDPMTAEDIMMNSANPRNFLRTLPYYRAAVASGDPLRYFGQHPQPITTDQGTTAGGQPQPQGGTPTAPGPDFHVTGGPGNMRRPGESPEAFLKRTGG